MKQKIIFFGSGNYTIPIVEMLKNHGFTLVITTEKEGEFINYLENNKLDYIVSDLKNPRDIETIEKIKPSIGILASYGAIIPREVIKIFPLGIFNIHPSLLPKYKGPSPIQAAILNGDQTTGVSVIKVDNKIDHGPIICQKEIILTGLESTKDLKESLFKTGGQMLEELLIKIETGQKIKEKTQDHQKEIFTKKISRDNGFIDIDNPPSTEKMDRMIRAYYPWPGVFFRANLFGKTKTIKLLPQQKIQVEGARVMRFADFVNGYQKEGLKILLKLSLFSSYSKA